MRTTGFSALITLGLAFAYAVVRYHVAKGEPLSRIPLWTTNKAVALTGLLFLCGSFSASRFGWSSTRAAALGSSGYTLTAFHSLASLLLLGPSYYSPFFRNDDTMTLAAELSLLAALVALACFSLAALTSLRPLRETLTPERWQLCQRSGVWGLYFAAIHLVLLGLPRFELAVAAQWIRPAAWPQWAGIPLIPISLLSFLIAIVTIMLRWVRTPTR